MLLSLCRRRARAVGFVSPPWPGRRRLHKCENIHPRGRTPLLSLSNPCTHAHQGETLPSYPTRVHTPARTRARERARQHRHPSPCHHVAPLRRATPSLTTTQRACRPYHALVLVGRAADALFACWLFHFSLHRLAGALSTAGDLYFPSDPRPCRRRLTPAKTTLLSTLSVP
jgi:hypothetical protein